MVLMTSEFLNRKINPVLAVSIICILVILGGIVIIVIPKAKAFYFAGIVQKYNPVCVLDTPAIAPVTCGTSCPLCTGVLGSACVGFEEVSFTPLGMGSFICAPKGFSYFGGGPPVPGMPIAGFGSSAVSPEAVGTAL